MSETKYIEKFWKDATPQDAAKEPPMVARFLRGKSDWFIGKLHGCWRDFDDKLKWGDGTGLCSTTCQVYDAPDPGEGWRLIDVEKETPQVGDGIYYPAEDRWLNRQHDKPYDKELIYRRRIEQPKPKYVPFEWEDREQLRGRWIVDGDGDEHCIVRLELYQEIFSINGASAEDALEDWHFLDTGKPFGKRVV